MSVPNMCSEEDKKVGLALEINFIPFKPVGFKDKEDNTKQ